MSLRKQIADLTMEPPSRKPPTLAELEKLAREHRRFMNSLARRGRSSPARSFLRGMFPLRRRMPIKPMFIRDDATALAFDLYMVGQDMWAAVGQFENSAEYKQAMERRKSRGRAMPIGDAARIHRYCRGQVRLARADGEAQVRFRVGDIRDDIGLDFDNATIDICSVLETQKFAREARVELLNKIGPVSGLDTVYRFRVL